MQFLHAVHCFNFKFFTIKVGMRSYFLYLKILFVLRFVPTLKQQFNELVGGKSQINRDQKWNLLFLEWHDQCQKFQIKFVIN